MTITEQSQGEQMTLTLSVYLTDATYSTSITGRLRRPLVDGLLWWALGRTLDHIVANALASGHPGCEQMGELVHTGERLVAYLFATPFHQAENPKAERIMDLVAKHLPELAPLVTAMPEFAEPFALAQRLTTILTQRIEHSYGNALHGVEDVYTQTKKAA